MIYRDISIRHVLTVADWSRQVMKSGREMTQLIWLIKKFTFMFSSFQTPPKITPMDNMLRGLN